MENWEKWTNVGIRIEIRKEVGSTNLEAREGGFRERVGGQKVN